MYYARIIPLDMGIDRRTKDVRHERSLIAAIKKECRELGFMGRWMLERYHNGSRISCTIEG